MEPLQDLTSTQIATPDGLRCEHLPAAYRKECGISDSVGQDKDLPGLQLQEILYTDGSVWQCQLDGKVAILQALLEVHAAVDDSTAPSVGPLLGKPPKQRVRNYRGESRVQKTAHIGHAELETEGKSLFIGRH